MPIPPQTSSTRSPRPVARSLRLAAAAALIFGVLTIISGGSVLFGPASAREAAGAVVPFVLWFNFLAGFAYVAAAFGLWRGAGWAPGLAVAILGGTLIVVLGFVVHVAGGGDFAPRTVGALALRAGFWAVVTGLAWRLRPRAGGAPG